MSDPSDPPVAVLDTSVLYPVWSRVLLRRLAVGQSPSFRGIWSREIARELWRTFSAWGVARGLTPEQAQHQVSATLYPLRQVLILVDGERRPPGTPASPLPDPDDAHLWNAALNGGAGYIVSHNTRHFPPTEWIDTAGAVVSRHLSHGIKFLTAIEFIEDVLGFDAATIYGAPLPAGGIVRGDRSRR